MKRNIRKQMTVTLLTGALLLPAAGCGDMLSESIKTGIYNWVTVNLDASSLANQLMQLIDDTFN